MFDCDSALTKTLTILLMVGLAVPVHAEIWECLDKESGAKRFTNIPSEAHGCRALNVRGGKAPLPRAERTANFPSIDNDTQRQREADRRRILDLELAQEQQLLDEARKALAEQGASAASPSTSGTERLGPYARAVKLHEDNIENLKKEIGAPDNSRPSR